MELYIDIGYSIILSALECKPAPLSESRNLHQVIIDTSINIALILGPMCEKNFVCFMDIQKGNFWAITSSPIAMAFQIVAVAVILFSIYNQNKINKRKAAKKAE